MDVAPRSGRSVEKTEVVRVRQDYASGCRSYLAEWVQAVNQQGGFGRWRWDVAKEPGDVLDILARHVTAGSPSLITPPTVLSSSVGEMTIAVNVTDKSAQEVLKVARVDAQASREDYPESSARSERHLPRIPEATSEVSFVIAGQLART